MGQNGEVASECPDPETPLPSNSAGPSPEGGPPPAFRPVPPSGPDWVLDTPLTRQFANPHYRPRLDPAGCVRPRRPPPVSACAAFD